MDSSDDEGATPVTAGARKSGRARKSVNRLSLGGSAKKATNTKSAKGKGKASDDEEDELEDDSSDEEEAAEDSDFEQEAEEKPKKKPRASAAGRKSIGSAKKGTRGKTPTQTKRAAPRRKRAPAGDSDDDDDDAPAAAGPGGKDIVVDTDNTIYNAVKSPNSSLQTVADDWIGSYESDPGPAMAELITFILRSCGCNSMIDEHQAMDENGIVEVLADIQDEFKSAILQSYPLASRSKPFKKFRSSLTSFLTRLFVTTASTEILYDDTFNPLFQAFLTSLSSSKIRAFRHTSTVVALGCIASLSEVAVTVNKEFSQASRAVEAEGKKGKKDKGRLKDLTKLRDEVHERKVKLEGYLTEIFEGVFVHRYRDSEAVIRSECIKALGGWMKIYPDYYLDGNYLRYIGWVLSDEHKDVRQEAVKSLLAVYASEAHIGQVQHFTHRFKGQLVRMAVGEIDLTVRISALLVLRQIDKHGLLEEEQRESIGKLVFEEEKRVRNTVAGFFAGLLEERVEDKIEALEAARGGASDDSAELEEERKEKLRLKCLAELLVTFGKQLDERDDAAEDDEQNAHREDDDVVLDRTHRGRVAFAVEALWEHVDSLRDISALLDYLLLDHSVPSPDDMDTDDLPAPGKAKKDKKLSKKGVKAVEECYALKEEEETILVEVLVACLTRSNAIYAVAKKDKDEDAQSQIGRAVIDALPRLFAKHQTHPARIVDVLAIPRLIALEQYHQLTRVDAYGALWSDIIKQFLKHTDSNVIDQAVKTIRHLLSTVILRDTNTTKLSDLQLQLVVSLREAVEGRDVESSVFVEDELLALGSCVGRLERLYTACDLSEQLDDTEDGKQTSAWEIVDSLAERGRLGYKDEDAMIQHALNVLGAHLTWSMQKIAAKDQEDALDGLELASIVERRRALMEKLEEFSVGGNSNAVEGVKQAALVVLLNVYMCSAALTIDGADPNGRLADLRLEMQEQLQARCAGFVEAEIERYAESIEEEAEDGDVTAAEDDEDEDELVSDEDEVEAAKRRKQKGKKGKSKSKSNGVKPTPNVISAAARNAQDLARLVAAGRFEHTLGPFVRAIHVGVVDIRHASVILIHYERLTSTFDQWARMLVQDLRDEGIYGDAGTLVARIVNESLQGAFDLYLDSGSVPEERIVSLSRLLVGSIVVRGAQLAIIKRLPTDDHVRIHTDAAVYIVAKLSSFESTKRKESRNKALSFFKALSNLLIGIDGKGALKIKSTLDTLIEASTFDVPASAKVWEPLRGYEKRLVTAMSKDPSIEVAAKAKVKKVAAAKVFAGSDDDDAPVARAPPRARRLSAKAIADQKAADASDSDEDVMPVRKPRLKQPASIPAINGKASAAAKRKQAEAEDISDLEVDDDEDEDAMEVAGAEDEEDDDDEVASQLLPSSQTSIRKRRLVLEEVPVEEEVEDDIEDADEEVQSIARPPSSTVSVSDIRRKKKARR